MAYGARAAGDRWVLDLGSGNNSSACAHEWRCGLQRRIRRVAARLLG
jgi:hypothetical protein